VEQGQGEGNLGAHALADTCQAKQRIPPERVIFYVSFQLLDFKW